MARMGHLAHRRHCKRREAIHFHKAKKEWIASSQALLAMTWKDTTAVYKSTTT
jgi:hypothetical protein